MLSVDVKSERRIGKTSYSSVRENLCQCTVQILMGRSGGMHLIECCIVVCVICVVVPYVHGCNKNR